MTDFSKHLPRPLGVMAHTHHLQQNPQLGGPQEFDVASCVYHVTWQRQLLRRQSVVVDFMVDPIKDEREIFSIWCLEQLHYGWLHLVLHILKRQHYIL